MNRRARGFYTGKGMAYTEGLPFGGILPYMLLSSLFEVSFFKDVRFSYSFGQKCILCKINRNKSGNIDGLWVKIIGFSSSRNDNVTV